LHYLYWLFDNCTAASGVHPNYKGGCNECILQKQYVANQQGQDIPKVNYAAYCIVQLEEIIPRARFQSTASLSEFVWHFFVEIALPDKLSSKGLFTY
jgi:hypothetical protein